MNAFDIAWSLLKADPDAQMVDSMRRRTGMGTIPDSVMGMLASRGLNTSDVSLPMQNLRDVRQRFGEESEFVPEVQHEDSGLGSMAEGGGNFLTPTSDQEFFDTGVASADEQRVTPAHFKGGEVTPGPEEGFLTPSQAFMSSPELADNLRRNVGGQQMGEKMRGLRHQTSGQTGVARGAELRNRSQAVEPEAPAPRLSDDQLMQQRMQTIMEAAGKDFNPTIDMTPQQDTPPMEIPMEIQNKIRDVPNYGMNEAAAELNVDPVELRRGMKALPGFRSGPSSRKLEYDQMAANLPEDMGFAEEDTNMPFNENRGAHTGDTRGFLQPTGGYAKFKQGQDREAAMGIGDEGSMHSELMGMEGGLSPEANAAALARLGLSPTDIDLADHDMRAAQARDSTSELRSMRGMGDENMEEGTSKLPVLGEDMGMVESANQQQPRTKRYKGGQGNLYPTPDAQGKTRL